MSAADLLRARAERYRQRAESHRAEADALADADVVADREAARVDVREAAAEARDTEARLLAAPLLPPERMARPATLPALSTWPLRLPAMPRLSLRRRS